MLQKMRGFARSWISSVFLIGLGVAFASWGVGDIFKGGGQDTSIATVGNVKIQPTDFQREFHNFERQVSAREKHDISPEEARAKGIDKSVLTDMINSSALDQGAADYGLIASDAQVSGTIRTMPQFRGPLGGFDHDVFLRVLQANNLNEDQVISLIRGDLVRNQLINAAGSGMAMPPAYGKLFFDYINEVRAVQYVVVSPQALPPVPPPSDAQLTAFMNAHRVAFSTPEYRDVTYVAVTPDDVEKKLTVSDAQLKQRYDEDKDQYQIPEKRDVEQLQFPDEAAAKAARAKIDAKTKFEDIAKASGKSEGDTSLGTLVQADLGDDRGPATFALPVNGVTQPIKTTFGWVILHVTKITPGVNKSFDDVKDKLRKEQLDRLAADKITDISNAFEDARAGGDSFTEAATKSGMHVVHVPAVDANGLQPDGTKANLPTEPEFGPQLARADVGEEGDSFQASDGAAFAIKVSGVTPPKLKPFDSIRTQLVAAWTNEQRRQQIASFATQLTAKANADHSLTRVAAELHTNVQSSGAIEHQAPVSGPLSAELVERIFAAPGGAAVSAPSQKGDSYLIALVTGVTHPSLPLNNPYYERMASEVGNKAGEDMGTALANAWRTKLGVKINQSQVDRVTGGS